MLGTLTVNNVNLALGLVEEGLAEVYSSCSDRVLITAEKVAKENKIGVRSLIIFHHVGSRM
jgi:endonuclease YncB( thermonuclease family)